MPTGVRRIRAVLAGLAVLAVVAASCDDPEREAGQPVGSSTPGPVAPDAHHEGRPPIDRHHDGDVSTTTNILNTSTTEATSAPDRGSCPGARTCAFHHFTNAPPPRWPAAADGTTVIDFAISVTANRSPLTTAEVVDAIRAAARTWEVAVPSVRFRYMGLVDELPVSGDGTSVIGFSPRGTGAGLTQMLGSGPGRWGEADTLLPARPGWVWEPCGGPAGPCTAIPVDRDQAGTHDLQAIATHELGHWLSLGDLNGDPSLADLTMWNQASDPLIIERRQTTLALGDVVGARRVYPCRCPRPEVEAP